MYIYIYICTQFDKIFMKIPYFLQKSLSISVKSEIKVFYIDKYIYAQDYEGVNIT